jgi:hypothetical protein
MVKVGQICTIYPDNNVEYEIVAINKRTVNLKECNNAKNIVNGVSIDQLTNIRDK